MRWVQFFFLFRKPERRLCMKVMGNKRSEETKKTECVIMKDKEFIKYRGGLIYMLDRDLKEKKGDGIKTLVLIENDPFGPSSNSTNFYLLACIAISWKAAQDWYLIKYEVIPENGRRVLTKLGEYGMLSSLWKSREEMERMSKRIRLEPKD